MHEAIWFSVNVLIGLPLAAALIIAAREILRALLALALGFRVFELRWGAGRRVWTKSIGPIDLVAGALPISASLGAESGSARNHRAARLAQVAIPLSIQLGIAIWFRLNDAAPFSSLLEGHAPLASLRLANLLILIVHGLIAFEFETGDRTDIRILLDIAFGPSDANRHARASYYARFARHWLDRGDVARAKSILARGLTQLGRDSLIVACETRVLAQDLDSVVDQGACSNALRLMIEDDAPRRRRDAGRRSPFERARQVAITTLPLVVAALGYVVVASDQVAAFAHRRLVHSSAVVAEAGDAEECEAALIRWTRWTTAIDPLLRRNAAMLRDRHAQLSRLERCRGNLEGAFAHQIVANEAAEQVHSSRVDASPASVESWVDNQIRLAGLLRQTAELENDRRRFRIALATLARADAQLEEARQQIGDGGEPNDAKPSDDPLAVEKKRIEIVRNEVLDRMGVDRGSSDVGPG
jgi:hypothetical protein